MQMGRVDGYNNQSKKVEIGFNFADVIEKKRRPEVSGGAT